MRGKENRRMDRRFHTRITPAYAGKRAALANCRPCSQDHPRLCGEKSLGLTVYLHVSGSPPPMRGKDSPIFPGRALTGITPAYAGKSLDGKTKVIECLGSPPPMRGKEPLRHFYLAYPGITPAYAGKSFRFLDQKHKRRDHPRLCGEKFIIRHVSNSEIGSPPPMRGKVILKGEIPARCRITPAYAGKSKISSIIFSAVKDHPRLCGEKLMCRQKTERRIGSPPPMRGKD